MRRRASGCSSAELARDRIPMVARRGEWLYNLWQDADHKRGLWRRTSLAEYRQGPAACGRR